MKVNVDLTDDIELSAYSDILSQFNQWIEFNREVKLLSLLNQNKKIKFEVEVIKSKKGSICGYIDPNLTNDRLFDISLSNICFEVKSFEFIILDCIVKELQLEIDILPTTDGNILMKLVSDGLPFKIKQYIEEGSVKKFYTSVC